MEVVVVTVDVLVVVFVVVVVVLNVVSDVDAADTALVRETVVMAVVDSEVVEVDVIVDVFVVVIPPQILEYSRKNEN